MSDYVIRPAALDDAEALFAFGERLLTETDFYLRTPRERAASADEMRIVVERFAAAPRHVLLTAWRGAEAVGEGMLMGGLLERNAHVALLGIGILQAHAGAGLGRRMMAALEKEAVECGLYRLELTVLSHNARARRLYEAMGYEEEGRKRASALIDGVYRDEILMAKVLPPIHKSGLDG